MVRNWWQRFFPPQTKSSKRNHSRGWKHLLVIAVTILMTAVSAFASPSRPICWATSRVYTST